MTYEEFLARAKEATPRPTFWRELVDLYTANGSLQVLVLMILQQREDLKEMLAARQMMSEADIRQAIGIQGQIAGVDVILQSIHAAMERPNEDPGEVSAQQRAESP